MSCNFLIAGIAVDNTAYSFDMIFSYKVPENLRKSACAGKRALVPFGKGNRLRQGMVMSLSYSDDDSLKEISSFLDEEQLLTEEMIQLARFIRDRYFCTYYDAVRVMLPGGINYKITTLYSAKEIPARDFESLSNECKELYLYIKNSGAPVKKDKILSLYKNGEALLSKLCRRGAVNWGDDIFRKTGDAKIKMVSLCEDADLSSCKLTPKQKKVADMLSGAGKASVKEICYYTGFTESVTDGLVKKGAAYYFQDEVMRRPYTGECLSREPDIILNSEQQAAFDSLYGKYICHSAAASLLYGVTGSGKTSVFMKLIDKCFRDGRGAILMVPEIALTPQLVRIFTGRFGDNVALFHSGLSIGERLDEYKRVSRGEAKIVLGTRSAVFAPLKDIGLIVLDEEQEASYKSQQTPRYHARDIAKFRCSRHNALLLLSSATPSLESYYMAEKGIYSLVTINNRYGSARLPGVSVVDMNEEIANGNMSICSNVLKSLIAENLVNKKQSIILLNRRGYKTFVSCRSCKEVITCPNCSVSMTYHSANNRLMCHYCGYSAPYTDECPNCGGDSLMLSGAGTQKGERELLEMFPEARVLRMDADAAMAKGSYETKLSAFSKGEYDILIGTQMVAKGLDFPNVTLVGVLNADQMLYSDDFRSYERTFSLLTQVVGRSGRGNTKGVAVIQTNTPENPVIRLAANQDYKTFYNDEIQLRRAMLYPPFSDMCLISFSGINQGVTLECASDFQRRLIELIREEYRDMPLRVLGPCKAPVYKVSNRFRFNIILKCRNSRDFRNAVKTVLKDYLNIKQFKSITISVDINPMSFG